MANRDRTTSPTRAPWMIAVLCVVTVAACTSSHPSSAASATTSAGATISSPDVANSPASGPSPLIVATTTPAIAPTPTLAIAPTPTLAIAPTPSPTAVPTIAPTAKAVAPTPTHTSSAPPTPLLVTQLTIVGNAQQVVIVTSANWTTDIATLQTFEKDAGVWHTVFPAIAAHIGSKGFSADKHEGDDKTPTGSYSFGTMFGQHASPGVKFPYRVADSQSVWVDSPSSPFYNTWQENAALTGEHLAAVGFATAYAYAVDIAYNTNPVVPGRGSAIFLHVSTGGGTAGCVSIAKANLLTVLRWLDPARSPIIVMGPTSVIRQY